MLQDIQQGGLGNRQELGFLDYRQQAKRERIEEAINYSRKLGAKRLKFIGICGSVSYLPDPDDDIDLFLVTERGMLWTTLLRAFIARRIGRHQRICLSLNMDEEYASRLFSGGLSGLQRKDAEMVISIYGDKFYNNLRSMPIGKGSYTTRKFRIPNPINFLLFAVLGTYLVLKGFYVNKYKYVSSHGEFSTHISLRYFYFDSRKYRELEKEMNGGHRDAG
ncbi:MAG: hypothetical protein QW812_03270 [Thermoplasmataceae archaeon]